MICIKIILISSLLILSDTQQTRIVKKNVFLHRNKRYLAFPERSNFVITLSLGKPLMMAQPKGFVLALECDIPFALPSDTRLYKKERRNYVIQRRNILSNFESAFNKYGLNGNACVKRMICEAQQNNIPDKSLIKDILSAIFNGSESDYLDYVKPCSHLTFSECPVPWLNYILGSLRAS